MPPWAQTLLATVLTLVAVEAMLQLVHYPAPIQVGWRWAESPYANPALRGQPPVNQLGLRGQPFVENEGDFVVLLVGDSYVEAGLQPYEDMPEAILERILQHDHGLPARVYSIAAAGWGQDQQLLALDGYFRDWDADLVLAWVTPVNDYWENAFVDRSVESATGPLKPTLARHDGAWEWNVPQSSPLKLVQLIALSVDRLRFGPDSPVETAARLAHDAGLPAGAETADTGAACPTTIVPQDRLIVAAEDGGPITVQTAELFAEGRSHFAPFATIPSLRDVYQIELQAELMGRIETLSAANDAEFRIIYPSGSTIDRALATVGCVKERDLPPVAVDYRDALRQLRWTALADSIVQTKLIGTEPTILGPDDWHLNRTGNTLFLEDVASQLGL